MDETFRGFLDRLRQAGELVDLHQPVDIRHIATLVDQFYAEVQAMGGNRWDTSSLIALLDRKP